MHVEIILLETQKETLNSARCFCQWLVENGFQGNRVIVSITL